MEKKIPSISLQLNFTPKILGCYGLIRFLTISPELNTFRISPRESNDLKGRRTVHISKKKNRKKFVIGKVTSLSNRDSGECHPVLKILSSPAALSKAVAVWEHPSLASLLFQIVRCGLIN